LKKKKRGEKKGMRNHKGMMLSTNLVGGVKREKWEMGRGEPKK